MIGLMSELCDAYANVALLIQAGLITSKDYSFIIMEASFVLCYLGRTSWINLCQFTFLLPFQFLAQVYTFHLNIYFGFIF